MTKFNGHKNWNHWNVSLWINNDEGLYSLARDCVKRSLTKADAAFLFIQSVRDCGAVLTPDGAPYSVSSVRAAMVEMNNK